MFSPYLFFPKRNQRNKWKDRLQYVNLTHALELRDSADLLQGPTPTVAAKSRKPPTYSLEGTRGPEPVSSGLGPPSNKMGFAPVKPGLCSRHTSPTPAILWPPVSFFSVKRREGNRVPPTLLEWCFSLLFKSSVYSILLKIWLLCISLLLH